jgi:hypothetical protein
MRRRIGVILRSGVHANFLFAAALKNRPKPNIALLSRILYLQKKQKKFVRCAENVKNGGKILKQG